MLTLLFNYKVEHLSSVCYNSLRIIIKIAATELTCQENPIICVFVAILTVLSIKMSDPDILYALDILHNLRMYSWHFEVNCTVRGS